MNSIDLAGQVAVVTGGASGFGFACAKRFVQSGAKVSLWDIRGDHLKQASDELGGVHTQQVSVTDYPALERALAETERTVGPVSIMVNSAGIAGRNALLDEYPIEEWRQVIDVNLTGTFYVNRVVVPGMKARNYGRIVNVSSVSGKEGNPTHSPYASSKAGVIAMTKSLGKELAKYDIAVNAITPSPARTRMLEGVTDEFVQYMLARIPRARMVEVEELAAMVAWLVSKENSYTTASVFDLSGGRTTY